MKNLFQNLSAALPDEMIETLIETETVRIERIVSDGHASPPGFWYDQPEHEWVVILSGSGELRFDDSEEVIELKPGDFINIPAHRKHRVEATDANEKTVWLAVFYR
ncbi:cupin domain-containing protein [Thalassoglobus sp.]|uniref:cupin domain-containing protein n=1 Tax=Thalassoglobus sp. TaxID=2795869 RepID=UPI003AA8534A